MQSVTVSYGKDSYYLDILRYLPIEDFLRSSLVCRIWNRIVDDISVRRITSNMEQRNHLILVFDSHSLLFFVCLLSEKNVPWLSLKQKLKLLTLFRGMRCSACKNPLKKDGSHPYIDHDNLVILCKDCQKERLIWFKDARERFFMSRDEIDLVPHDFEGNAQYFELFLIASIGGRRALELRVVHNNTMAYSYIESLLITRGLPEASAHEYSRKITNPHIHRSVILKRVASLTRQYTKAMNVLREREAQEIKRKEGEPYKHFIERYHDMEIALKERKRKVDHVITKN